MNVKMLKDVPSWEWPADAGDTLLGILRNPQSDKSERLIAAELAGDFVVVNDDLALALLSIVRNIDEGEKLRGKAAIGLGPALEHADLTEFDDEDDILISEEVFKEIQQSLQELYEDSDVPKDVRRKILEASVRAPQEWHVNAVTEAYSSDDDSWNLTAVFCMRFIPGFDDQILEALESNDADIHYEAVSAAGNWGIEDAWPHIEALVASDETDKPLLLAAIGAVASIRPEEASVLLGELINSKDEDIVDAAFDALTMAELPDDDEDDDEDEDEEDEGDGKEEDEDDKPRR